MGSLNINALMMLMANVLLKTASISVMHASFDRNRSGSNFTSNEETPEPAWYICKPKAFLSLK